MSKRKPIRRTIVDARQAPPRPVTPKRRARAGYPTAAELLSSSGEWQRWLDDALRSVLRPAALAGAVGFAAAASSGCADVAEEARPPIATLLGEGDAAAQDAAAEKKSGVVMFPVPGAAGAGGGSKAGSGGIVAHPLPVQPPQPPSSGGSSDVVDDRPPDPPATDGLTSVGPKPPVLPPSRPPHIRGLIRPIDPSPDPPAVPGGL